MKRAPKQLIPYTGKRVMITLITLIIRQVDPLVAESHTFKPPACSNYFQLFTNRRRAKRKLMIIKNAATPSCNQLSLNGR